MASIIEEKIKEYNPVTQDDYKNAIKEILQNIILVGLKKAGFFSHGAFYGGTALRIFYGVDRFSEDLDFTLYSCDKSFSFEPYFETINDVAKEYGFIIETKQEVKSEGHQHVLSAFLKTGTKISIISCKAPQSIYEHLSDFDKLRIKFEADIEPPLGFKTEEIDLKFPEPCMITVLDKPSLLAGKICAILYRNYKNRVKGRDYYDFKFLINGKTPVNLEYLKNKIKLAEPTLNVDSLTIDDIKNMIIAKINSIDMEKVNDDLEAFISWASNKPILSRDELLECVSYLVPKKY